MSKLLLKFFSVVANLKTCREADKNVHFATVLKIIKKVKSSVANKFNFF